MQNCFKISDSNFWNDINQTLGNEGGVYKIISIQNGKPRPVPRFLETDEAGILYIGKAESFLDRVIELKKSILAEYKGRKHICGRRYKHLCEISTIAEKFPPETLHVLLFPHDFPKILENDFLQEYEKKFGEVPPLNALSSSVKNKIES
jgi:hypothetical protein